ncbi:MAG: hypothetical protein K8I27_11245 [Planctomycetes bacterium]|nr:hypothetical protein [Planctomycetota bacterium]
MRFSLLLLSLLVAACASTRQPLERGALSPDTVVVIPTRNLSGRPLLVPEIYLGDAVGKAAHLKVDNIDLATLSEAAVYSRLSELGYRVELEQNVARFAEAPKYEAHSAITVFDMDETRSTGRYRMGIIVMLVRAVDQVEVARGYSEQEFQLLDEAPDEVGALGTARFIEQRLQIYTEGLARDAVDAGGF